MRIVPGGIVPGGVVPGGVVPGGVASGGVASRCAVCASCRAAPYLGVSHPRCAGRCRACGVPHL
ncbi:hypothetical protein, partial [Paractinoplanes deccanensis]|uniref:hypothetical protein n=1 Tax=Paractinoplanes deccanensis TaxID=113561 RepID=UPI001944BB55